MELLELELEQRLLPHWKLLQLQLLHWQPLQLQRLLSAEGSPAGSEQPGHWLGAALPAPALPAAAGCHGR
jgi:hypothetical protein